MRRFVQALSAIDPFDPAIADDIVARLLELPDRYNLGIGDAAGIIFLSDGQWSVAPMRWGLVPSWEPEPVTSYSTQTARVDRAPSSRLYRRAWKQRRCLLPFNGYYKWEREHRPRLPHFIQPSTVPMLFAAALWERWGDDVDTFSVLTHATDAIPSPLTPDGPVLLDAANLDAWMRGDPNAAQALAEKAEAPALEAYRVTRQVANRKRDDYQLLEPVPEGDDTTPVDEDVDFDED